MSDLERRLAAAKKGGPKPGGCAVTKCLGKPCSELWNAIDTERTTTLAIKDPILRNRQISAQYARLYAEDHRLEWVGLASVVSRQAGCAMVKAKKASLSRLAMKAKPAGDAYDALVEANGVIYDDIYPVASFYQKHGLARLKDCSSTTAGGHQVDPKLLGAFEQIDTGTDEGIRRGSDMIANYEQRDIIQDSVYARERYKKAFEENEKWTQGWREWIGAFGGAEKPELPLSTSCTEEGKVPFTGSILDPNARVAYYEKLRDTYNGLPQQERDRMVTDLVLQAQ